MLGVFGCFIVPTNSTSASTNKLVKIVTNDAISLTVPRNTVAVGVSYEFRTESSWYADFDFLREDNLLGYKGIILCEVVMEEDNILTWSSYRTTVVQENTDFIVPTGVVEQHSDAYRINKKDSPANGMTFTPPNGVYYVGYLGNVVGKNGPGLFFFDFAPEVITGIEILGKIDFTGGFYHFFSHKFL